MYRRQFSKFRQQRIPHLLAQWRHLSPYISHNLERVPATRRIYRRKQINAVKEGAQPQAWRAHHLPCFRVSVHMGFKGHHSQVPLAVGSTKIFCGWKHTTTHLSLLVFGTTDGTACSRSKFVLLWSTIGFPLLCSQCQLNWFRGQHEHIIQCCTIICTTFQKSLWPYAMRVHSPYHWYNHNAFVVRGLFFPKMARSLCRGKNGHASAASVGCLFITGKATPPEWITQKDHSLTTSRGTARGRLD